MSAPKLTEAQRAVLRDGARTLNEVLAAFGVTHRPVGSGPTHEHLRDGRVVFTGTVSQAWDWVRAGCPETTDGAS